MEMPKPPATPENPNENSSAASKAIMRNREFTTEMLKALRISLRHLDEVRISKAAEPGITKMEVIEKPERDELPDKE
jgi:hypothetical protein